MLKELDLLVEGTNHSLAIENLLVHFVFNSFIQ